MRNQGVFLSIVSLLLIGPILSLSPRFGLAENIDPDDNNSQYAYGENVGWLNAEPSGNGGPGVEVEDTKLTGYIWAENIGWVSLSCENTSSCATVNYGVTNDGNGNLSGCGWGENVGWISFSCENTSSCATVSYGVTIDLITGEFSGHGWGENVGWVTFRSTGLVPFEVKTSWTAIANDCDHDSDEDGDVDGSELAEFADNFNVSQLAGFAAEFGRTNCLE